MTIIYSNLLEYLKVNVFAMLDHGPNSGTISWCRDQQQRLWKTSGAVPVIAVIGVVLVICFIALNPMSGQPRFHSSPQEVAVANYKQAFNKDNGVWNRHPMLVSLHSLKAIPTSHTPPPGTLPVLKRVALRKGGMWAPFALYSCE